MIGDGQLDDLMEEVVAMHQHWLSNMTLSSVRVWLLTMIQVIQGGEFSHRQCARCQSHLGQYGDIANPDSLVDKLDIFARDFGGMAKRAYARHDFDARQNVDNHYDEAPSRRVKPKLIWRWSSYRRLNPTRLILTPINFA